MAWVGVDGFREGVQGCAQGLSMARVRAALFRKDMDAYSLGKGSFRLNSGMSQPALNAWDTEVGVPPVLARVARAELKVSGVRWDIDMGDLKL